MEKTSKNKGNLVVKEYTLKIDSRDRNIKREKNPFKFRVDFKELNNNIRIKDTPLKGQNNGFLKGESFATIKDRYDNLKKLSVNEIIFPIKPDGTNIITAM